MDTVRFVVGRQFGFNYHSINYLVVCFVSTSWWLRASAVSRQDANRCKVSSLCLMAGLSCRNDRAVIGVVPSVNAIDGMFSVRIQTRWYVLD